MAGKGERLVRGAWVMLRSTALLFVVLWVGEKLGLIDAGLGQVPAWIVTGSAALGAYAQTRLYVPVEEAAASSKTDGSANG